MVPGMSVVNRQREGNDDAGLHHLSNGGGMIFAAHLINLSHVWNSEYVRPSVRDVRHERNTRPKWLP